MLSSDDLAAALAEAGTAQAEGRTADAATALAGFLDALNERPNLVDGGDQARLRARLAQLRIRLGDLPGALRVSYAALEIADDGYAALHLGRALTLTGAFEEAEGHLRRAANRARADGEGPLAIGAWCSLGEQFLYQGRAREAVEAFGKALGISEVAPGDGPSVLPLAGLADAHRAWRNPAKAPALAERAVERAERVGDPATQARALLALGVARADAASLDRGAALAEEAPHRPLLVRLWRTRLALDDVPELRARAIEEARAMGLTPERERLDRT